VSVVNQEWRQQQQSLGSAFLAVAKILLSFHLALSTYNVALLFSAADVEGRISDGSPFRRRRQSKRDIPTGTPLLCF
jgi:hypothetical protein